FGNCCWVQTLDLEGTRGRYLTAESQFTRGEEATCHMEQYVLPLSSNQGAAGMDPLYPIYGMDLCGTSPGAGAGATLRLGRSTGGAGAMLRVIKGLSVSQPASGVAVEVNGPDSMLFCYDISALRFELPNASDVGIWAKAGGKVRVIDSAGLALVEGSGKHFK